MTSTPKKPPRTALWLTVLAAILLVAAASVFLSGSGPEPAIELHGERGGSPHEPSGAPVAAAPAAVPSIAADPERTPVYVPLTEQPTSAVRATLAVRVVSADHGRALAGVEVVLAETGDFDPGDPERRVSRETSDAAGHASFDVDAGVAWLLDADPTDTHGYAALDVEALAPGEEREVLLRVPTEDDIEWFGRVTSGGEPFAGARVLLLEFRADSVALIEETQSDPTGLVRFTGASWRALDVRAVAPGVGVTVVEIAEGHASPAAAQELPLWPVASVRCTVVGPAGAGAPDIGVRAHVRSYELRPPDASHAFTPLIEVNAVTDAAGVCLLDGVPAELPVTFELRRAGELLLEEPRALVLPAGVVTERRFVIGGDGNISGRVEGLGAEPAGVRVDLYQNSNMPYEAQIFSTYMQENAQHSTETVASGRFAFDRVPYGAWHVGTRGRENAAEQYALAPRVVLSADQPSAQVTLRLERGLMIRGHVVDETGAGVGSIAAQSWNDTIGSVGNQISARDGSFAFGPMPAGLYNVWAHGTAGYVNVPVRSVAAGTDDLRIVLERGVELRGTVVDAISGAPIPTASLKAYAPESDRPYAFHGSVPVHDGRFALTDLPPGEIALKAETADGGIGILRGIQVQRGVDTATVTVRVHAGIPVRVRYVGEAPGDLALQALQDGVALAYIATRPGETTTFYAMPGPLRVLALGEGVDAEEQEFNLKPGDHPEVVLTPRD